MQTLQNLYMERTVLDTEFLDTAVSKNLAINLQINC